MHVAYKKYKIKRKFTSFLVNTKYIKSRELNTSEFSLMLRTRKNSVFSTHSMIYNSYSPQKRKYPLFISLIIDDRYSCASLDTIKF